MRKEIARPNEERRRKCCKTPTLDSDSQSSLITPRNFASGYYCGRNKNLHFDFNTAEGFNARIPRLISVPGEFVSRKRRQTCYRRIRVFRFVLQDQCVARFARHSRAFWFGLTTLHVKDGWAKYESPSTLLSPHMFYAGTHVSTKSA